jgi:hypothetical protein
MKGKKGKEKNRKQEPGEQKEQEERNLNKSRESMLKGKRDRKEERPP